MIEVGLRLVFSYLNISLNIYKFIKKTDSFSLKFLYSLLNQRKNSTNSRITLEIIKIEFEKLGDILQKNFNFGKIFKSETAVMFFMSYQSIFSDTICILVNDKIEINSKLTILSK